jgi:2-hydroxychromene-2-carboxylate isomerase
MGEVIPLEAVRQRREQGRRPGRARARATLYFDLVCPGTYLAAERVNRLFPQLEWRPALRDALHGGDPLADAAARERDELAAAARAEILRLPLVWPDGTSSARAAMRVASLACERGRGAAFVLAASRLAFCGGFELDDPEVLAEAAAAANIPLQDAFAAATDEMRDGPMLDDALRLLAAGAEVLPTIQVGRLLFSGEDRLSEAAAAAQAPLPRVRPEVPRAG